MHLESLERRTLLAAGDFSLDFVAAAPFTYDHSVGGGAFNDGTKGTADDVVESLQGGDFTCGDTVTYLTLITVGGDGSDDAQTIEIDYVFLANTTGQPGAGLVDVTTVAVNYGDVVNGDDGTPPGTGPAGTGLDSAIDDDRQTVASDTTIGGSVATILSEVFDPPGSTPFAPAPNTADELLLTVEIDGLESGEQIVLRIDVTIACDPGSDPTGNLQASVDGARLTRIQDDMATDQAISVGNQTVPFMKIGELQLPEITIDKFLSDNADEDMSGTVSLGDTLTYSFEVTNTGNVTLDPVVVTDPLPGLGAITGGASMLDPGDVTTFTATYVVTQADVDAGQIDNTATATGTPPVGDDVTDMDPETVPIPQDPAIIIDKFLSGNADEDMSGTVSLGDTLTYSFLVTNTGNVTLDPVVVTDPLPGLGAITGGALMLAPGAMTTFTATCVVTQADVDAGQIDNTATATGTPPIGDNVTDMDPETVPIPQDPAIIIDKFLSGNADEDMSGTVSLGDTLTYSFLVTNTGNVTLQPLLVTDPLEGLGLISLGVTALAPGAMTAFTATYVVTQADVDAGQINNTATARARSPIGVQVIDSDPEGVPIPQNPAILIDKFLSGNADEDDSGDVTIGDTLTYSYTVTNTGNLTLDPVVVTDMLPGLSEINCPKTFLAPGEIVTCTATYVVTAADEEAGEIVNTAVATGTTPDEGQVTDSDTEIVEVEEEILAPPEPEPQLIVISADKGATSQPFVMMFDKVTEEVLTKFLAYESTYRGGVRIATGDLTGDGIEEIVTAPGRSHVPEVRVFTKDGVELTQFRFLAYAANFDGGVQVAIGDVDGDGMNDIVTTPTAGPSVVKVFRNEFDPMSPTDDPISDTPYREFLAFPASFIGGSDIEVDDMGTFLDGAVVDALALDGKAEVLVGNGSGMRSTVHVFDAASADPGIVRTFLPFGDAFRGGVALTTARVNGSDLIPDLIVGTGNRGNSVVEVWDGRLGTQLSVFNAYTDASRNSPLRVAALDTNDDDIADRVVTAQGTDGKTREIRFFDPLTGNLEDVFTDTDPDFSGQYFVEVDPLPPDVDPDADVGTAALEGTDGDDVFEFIGGAAGSWTVRINGHLQDIGPEISALEFDGMGGHDTVLMTGTDGDDMAELWAGHGVLRGDQYVVTVVNVASIRIEGLGGDNKVTFHDSAGDDTFAGWAGGGMLTGPGVENRADRFGSIYVHATFGGHDVAKLYDSPGNDQFVATPAYGKLSGDAFSIETRYFEAVHAYATAGGVDEAKFYDSPGNDEFVATPTHAALFNMSYPQEHTGGFYNRAKFFESAHAFGTASDRDVDVARLYDSSGDDTFYADPPHAALYNNNYTGQYNARFYNRAKSFQGVHAYATTGRDDGTPGGHDVAHLHGGDGDDLFYADPDHGALYRPGEFYNRAKYFEEVYGEGHSGNDRAHLFDSELPDLLEANDDWIRLSNAALDFLYEGRDFEHVTATASEPGNNVISPDPLLLDFDLDLDGPW